MKRKYLTFAKKKYEAKRATESSDEEVVMMTMRPWIKYDTMLRVIMMMTTKMMVTVITKMMTMIRPMMEGLKRVS